MLRASVGAFTLLTLTLCISLGPSSALAEDADSEVIVLTSRIFDIPFQMEGDSKASVVRLYVSSDHGKSWTTAIEQPLPIQQFHYEAKTDGDYWFTHATDLDADPVTQFAPERKISIDTAGPAIDLQAGADLEGKLSGTLKLFDPHRVTALRVLYATDVVRQWQTVSNETIDAEGRFAIQPEEDWRQISVHVTATDSLGNASVHSKLFRRPRMAATHSPRLASNVPDDASGHDTPGTTSTSVATAPAMTAAAMTAAAKASPNSLRIQTVAGPSDPPSFLIGPAANVTAPNVTAPTGNGSLSTRSSVSLQSPGAGPLQLPDTGALRHNAPSNSHPTTTSIPGAALPATSTPAPSLDGRALNTFGSAFPAPGRQNEYLQSFAPPAPANSTAMADSTAVAAPRPMTLPASGLTAKVTPQGIEVLPAPNGEIENDSDATESRSGMRLPPPQPALNPPTGNPYVPDSAGNPAVETIPTPESEAVPKAVQNRPRTLEQAMRPISPNTDSASGRNSVGQGSPQSGPEVIPTPDPSQTPEDDRRYRVERAEQLSREQQERYDRALLARNTPFRWSDSNRFSLEYELEAVGASGVEAVELYGSTDAGKTWKRWGADPDRTSPFDIETKGEGVFAFRIVVLGNNGLSSPRPLPGDHPDIAVVVDQSLPKIKITSARYGEGDRTGSLVIRYECSDENLMNRPVSIAFSDSIDGPWTTIAAGLKNDGLYVWPADPKLPPAIYLRIDATDQAGNTGSYLLDQPIATGGLAPRARILGFQSR